uniref:Uncharacterized protein n=1 Tax=Rhizophora mucronata TaxID=61149 RepID=A0A2P2Q3W6_RHIMU
MKVEPNRTRTNQNSWIAIAMATFRSTPNYTCRLYCVI